MTMRLILFFSSSITLAVIHATAMGLSLYWTHLWLDMPMHFFGGVCVALGYSILPFFGIRFTPALENWRAYLSFVLFIGVCWEIFEYLNGISLVSESEVLFVDTGIDLTLDLLGGYLGYQIASRL